MRALVLLLGLVACDGGFVAFDSDSEGGTDAPVEETCDLDVCDGACVDLDDDPQNCGICGRTCVILQGRSACEAGECVLDTCDDGWEDCDGRLDNGCEAEVSCDPGAACQTTCRTEGTWDCGDACAPECVPPREVCNAVDDDCDGACDEDLGRCRVGVHRSSGGLGHMYGVDQRELERLGQTIEALNYFQVYGEAVADLKPLFRCIKPNGKRFLTTSTQCEVLNKAPEVTVGFLATGPRCGAIPLYRAYNGAQGNHFYTISARERDNAVANLGYKDEGVTGFVWR